MSAVGPETVMRSAAAGGAKRNGESPAVRNISAEEISAGKK